MSARSKIAEAIIKGKAMRIEGGNYKIAKGVISGDGSDCPDFKYCFTRRPGKRITK
ncbi:DUF134 domain-containing protein [Thermanaerosceptrum fracticalcis]|uniref:DUF134 domain-containing protein n=1 Tax=Thermanaerosceptrum fracticalcis TaxID=1712410 RepID=A0A7G6E1Z4_THEFR|nr:DUF134 domain-containing protein [Thermanaerosceptrum fracticalcis]